MFNIQVMVYCKAFVLGMHVIPKNKTVVVINALVNQVCNAVVWKYEMSPSSYLRLSRTHCKQHFVGKQFQE